MSNTGKTQKSRHKTHHKPKSKEWFRARLDQTEDNKYGRWKLLSREMLHSRAFAELSKSGMILVLTMLDRLRFEKIPTRAGRGVKRGRKYAGEVLANDGIFTVVNNDLWARGIKSSASVAKARVEAWELGFCDVLETATLKNPGVDRYSERWKHYPNGFYKPEGQPLPGKCLYPKRSKRTSESEVTHTSESEVTGSASLPARSNNIMDLDEQHTLQKVKLISNYGGTSASQPRRGPEHPAAYASAGSGASYHPEKILDPEIFKIYPSEALAPKNPLNPEILKMHAPAEVVADMEERGLTCTYAQRHPNEVLLKFSDGSAVSIGKGYTYVGPGGKPSHVCSIFQTLKGYLPVPAPVPDPIPPQVEEIMFNRGYGPCLKAERKHGELHLGFAEDVHVWLMPGSIKVERPGRRNLTVKDPEELKRKLVSENRNSAHDMPRQSSANVRL